MDLTTCICLQQFMQPLNWDKDCQIHWRIWQSSCQKTVARLPRVMSCKCQRRCYRSIIGRTAGSGTPGGGGLDNGGLIVKSSIRWVGSQRFLLSIRKQAPMHGSVGSWWLTSFFKAISSAKIYLIRNLLPLIFRNGEAEKTGNAITIGTSDGNRLKLQ